MIGPFKEILIDVQEYIDGEDRVCMDVPLPEKEERRAVRRGPPIVGSASVLDTLHVVHSGVRIGVVRKAVNAFAVLIAACLVFGAWCYLQVIRRMLHMSEDQVAESTVARGRDPRGDDGVDVLKPECSFQLEGSIARYVGKQIVWKRNASQR